jgi:acyl-CoA reductase-like NAD-dependent aldehyde dehydrogenase
MPVTDKFSLDAFASVSLADEKTIFEAISQCEKAFSAMKKLKGFQKREILESCIDSFTRRKEEFAQVLTQEVGKTIQEARVEVARMIDTFRIASEEAVRNHGDWFSLDRLEKSQNYSAMTKRVPVGPCSFIVPFNFPMNLTAHKVAPAIAAGCPFILKPASRTPVSVLMMGEVLSQTALPPGAFSILPCDRKAAELFTSDERLKLLSFTGSALVGWELKKKAGKKKVVLELGGNAASIVDKSADIDFSVTKLTSAAFGMAGQSCISVQRILVHSSILSEVREKLVGAANKIKMGDPKKEETQLGPMISLEDAKRIESWVNEAKIKGAKVLCGGKRTDCFYQPTLVENVDKKSPLWQEEAFAPIAVIEPFTEFSEAIEKVNGTSYGLQVGIFTESLNHTLRSWDSFEVGGVVINDVPTFRTDQMPYGGVKDSGFGREGVRYAMEDMTELRLLVINER